MRILLTGATGTAGSAALDVCLADPAVETVTVLLRRAPPVQHPKLKVVLHEDFANYGPIRETLTGQDACLWCLGVSQSDVSEAEYERITYDFAIAGASAMKEANPNLCFCFLSGKGADSAEKSRVLFARVKGRTENALAGLGLARYHAFRPGYIHPASPRPKPKLAERAGTVLAPVLRWLAPDQMIDAPDLGRAMLQAAKHGADKTILENSDIRALAAAARGNST